MRFGRIGGIDIGVHWSVLLIATLLAYGLYREVLPAGAPGMSSGAYAVAAVIVSVSFLAFLLAHELAHALVARHYGISVRRITLWLLGGVSELESEAPTPRAELFIAGAGPATSLAGGVVAFGAMMLADLMHASSLIVICLGWLAGVNVILGVFNLLPGAPLDGGRVLRAILWRVRGDKTAAQIWADRVGVFLGFALGLAGLLEILFARDISGLWLVLLGWFLIAAANAESAVARMHTALAGRTAGDIMSPAPVIGYTGATVESFVATIPAGARQQMFPLTDLDGEYAGIVSLAQLTRLPQPRRATTRLRELATPADRLPTIGPDMPAEKATKLLSLAQPVVAVLADHRVIGTITGADLAYAVDLASIRTRAGQPT